MMARGYLELGLDRSADKAHLVEQGPYSRTVDRILQIEVSIHGIMAGSLRPKEIS